MDAVPAATPVTTPPLTVAFEESDVLQVPPVTDSVNVVVEPAQTEAVPEIAAGVAGRAFTVSKMEAAELPAQP